MEAPFGVGISTKYGSSQVLFWYPILVFNRNLSWFVKSVCTIGRTCSNFCARLGWHDDQSKTQHHLPSSRLDASYSHAAGEICDSPYGLMPDNRAEME